MSRPRRFAPVWRGQLLRDEAVNTRETPKHAREHGSVLARRGKTKKKKSGGRRLCQTNQNQSRNKNKQTNEQAKTGCRQPLNQGSAANGQKKKRKRHKKQTEKKDGKNNAQAEKKKRKKKDNKTLW